LDGEAFFDSDITVEVVSKAVSIVAAGGAGYMRRAASL
jgi:hypothetical protein